MLIMSTANVMTMSMMNCVDVEDDYIRRRHQHGHNYQHHMTLGRLPVEREREIIRTVQGEIASAEDNAFESSTRRVAINSIFRIWRKTCDSPSILIVQIRNYILGVFERVFISSSYRFSVCLHNEATVVPSTSVCLIRSAAATEARAKAMYNYVYNSVHCTLTITTVYGHIVQSQPTHDRCIATLSRPLLSYQSTGTM